MSPDFNIPFAWATFCSFAPAIIHLIPAKTMTPAAMMPLTTIINVTTWVIIISKSISVMGVPGTGVIGPCAYAELAKLKINTDIINKKGG